MNNTCVYFHINPIKREVFYVGIGRPHRPYSARRRNVHWNNIINKYGYEVKIIHENLSWDEASKLEIKYIKEFGRKDQGLGPLINLTDGGNGTVGNIPWNKGKKGIIPWNKGIKMSDDFCKKVSIGKRGKKQSDLCKANKCKPIIQLSLTGEFICEFKSYTEAYQVTGISNIINVISNKRGTAGGYKWKHKQTI